MYTISNIRSIQALNSATGYTLTPVFEGSSLPVFVKVTEEEFSQVKGNTAAMKSLAVAKLTETMRFCIVDPRASRTILGVYGSALKSAAYAKADEIEAETKLNVVIVELPGDDWHVGMKAPAGPVDEILASREN